MLFKVENGKWSKIDIDAFVITPMLKIISKCTSKNVKDKMLTHYSEFYNSIYYPNLEIGQVIAETL